MCEAESTSLFRLRPPKWIARIIFAILVVFVPALWLAGAFYLAGPRSHAVDVFNRIVAVAWLQVLWLCPVLLFAGCAVSAKRTSDRILLIVAAVVTLASSYGFLLQAFG